MYSPEKLNNLEAMDNRNFSILLQKWPKAKMDKGAVVRSFANIKAERLPSITKKRVPEFANMTEQQKAELRKQLKTMEIAAELEVKRELAAEALEDIAAMISLN